MTQNNNGHSNNNDDKRKRALELVEIWLKELDVSMEPNMQDQKNSKE